MTPIYHIDINGRIWEINLPEQKVLLRSKNGLSDEQIKGVIVIPQSEIEEYIKETLHFRHIKKIRDTKLIFSQFPICNYIERNARNDNPDAYNVCVDLAATQTLRGYRCQKHKDS